MAKKIIDKTTTPEELEAQETAAENASKTKKAKSKGNKKVRGSKYAKARKEIVKEKSLSTANAIKEVRKAAFAKFNESVEIHIKLGIDKTKSDQRVRFITSLPYGIGKKVKVLVISDKNDGEKDGVIWRDSTVIDEILKGEFKPDTDFNIVVASPSAMKDIAKVAKILGPKGLMPSPKTGTVTDKPEKAIADLSKGQVEVKSQPSHAVIHQIVGNLGFKDEELEANINHLLSELNKNIPGKVKKKFIQNVYVCSTMSPSVKIES